MLQPGDLACFCHICPVSHSIDQTWRWNMFDQAQAGALQCQTTIPWTIIAAGWHLMGSSKDFLGSDLFFTQLLPLLSSSFALRSLRKANMRQFIKKSLGPNASNAREELFIQQLLFCCSMCFLLCSSREGPKVMLANALRLDVSSSIRTCWNMLEH